MTLYQLLWQRVVDRLDTQGFLTAQSAHSTPAEIAREITGKSGDNRVHRFVWFYYYPRAFGNEAGSMSDADAEALVASLAKAPSQRDLAPIDREFRVAGVDRIPCRLCGKRAPMEAGE
jgi:hypothetical protein